ncbi:GntR family transcriptional regulator [Halomonas ramblicola]|uniref:GntR family transcriptional regulator n=1 Tax=Halomonas ramblicola TaxID=747349 RepID=UPI0025B5FABB|nr:GntR family transcriptional regulator [Halomonas ramblicola]MDN3520147.1 GntR family transcriptional regulator [Halomonas ramblicola]
MENMMQTRRSYNKKASSSEVLAQSICALIVNEGMILGDHLREVHFADKLKVSRTLIRSAFKILEEQGILERRPNRGFFLRDVDTARSQLHDKNTPQSTGIDLHPLCYQLARDYLNNNLPGQITESDIVRKYDESRQNVQQALIEMEKEGWIQRLLGYGWEFGEFLTSSVSYEQCYRFRALIEPAALREPNYRPDKRVLEKLKQQQQELLYSTDGYPPSQIFNAGVEFHEAIVSFSGNLFLLEGLQKANRLRRLLEYSVHPSRRHPQRECEDHLHIISLLERGAYKEAASFLETHLAKAMKVKTGIVRDLLG